MIVKPEIGDFHIIYNNECWEIIQTCDYENFEKFRFRIIAKFFAKKYAKKNNTKLVLHRKDGRIIKIVNYNK